MRIFSVDDVQTDSMNRIDCLGDRNHISLRHSHPHDPPLQGNSTANWRSCNEERVQFGTIRLTMMRLFVFSLQCNRCNPKQCSHFPIFSNHQFVCHSEIVDMV